MVRRHREWRSTARPFVGSDDFSQMACVFLFFTDVGDLSGGGDTDVTDSTTPATTGATSPGDGAGTTTVATTPATTTTSSTTTTTPDVISAAERGDELSADDGISIGGAIGIGLAGAVSILFVTYMTMRSKG